MSWISVGVVGGLTTAGISTGLNIYNSSQAQNRAQSQLDSENNIPVPKYSESPALSQAHGLAIQDYFNPKGVTSTQRSIFNNNLATNTNANYTNSVNRSGGQLGGFIQGVNNAQNIGAINNFANTDATLTAQNRNNAAGRIDATAGQIQNINDKNTQTAIQRRMMIDQALGTAIGQQRTNLSNQLTSFGNTGLQMAGYGLGRMSGKTDIGQNVTDEYGNYNTAHSSGAYTPAPKDFFDFTSSPLALGNGSEDNTNYTPEGE